MLIVRNELKEMQLQNSRVDDDSEERVEDDAFTKFQSKFSNHSRRNKAISAEQHSGFSSSGRSNRASLAALFLFSHSARLSVLLNFSEALLDAFSIYKCVVS